jgi:hypothetical protein
MFSKTSVFWRLFSHWLSFCCVVVAFVKLVADNFASICVLAATLANVFLRLRALHFCGGYPHCGYIRISFLRLSRILLSACVLRLAAWVYLAVARFFNMADIRSIYIPLVHATCFRLAVARNPSNHGGHIKAPHAACSQIVFAPWSQLRLNCGCPHIN